MSAEIGQKTGLSEATISKLTAVIKQHPFIEKVVVYGSRAKGNFRPGSDIDLAVFSSTMSYLEQMKLADNIDDLLLPYTVDVLHFEKLTNAELIDHINRVGLVLYSR
jgi:predicted nucleotidyltransferase